MEQRFNVPRMAMAVAPIVIMMPGIYAYEMIVLFNRGPMLDALRHPPYAVSSSGHWQWV